MACLRLVLAAIFVLWLSSSNEALARKWTDNTGKFSVQAELVEQLGDEVRLKTEDGRLITVPFERLCKEDQQYLQSRTAASKKTASASKKETPPKKTAERKPAAGRATAAKPKDLKEPEGPLPVGPPNLQPTHMQIGWIKVTNGVEPTAVHTFCLGPDGNLMVGCGGQRDVFVPKQVVTPTGQKKIDFDVKTFYEPAQLRIFSPDGRPLALWSLDLTPRALGVGEDGLIYIGGPGKLAKLDRRGKVVKALEPDFLKLKPDAPPEDEDAAKPGEPRVQRSQEDEEEEAKAAIRARKQVEVSGIAVAKDDLFVACRARSGFAVWRMDHDFGNAKKIVDRLSGCCGQMDVQTHNGELFAAENARHRVVRYDREGKALANWGKSERTGIEGFGSCCNPMNLRFAGDGSLLTSESSLGRIKRYDPDGRLLGVLGVAKVELGCKHVPVDMSRDGTRIYVLNIGQREIAVLASPSATPAKGAKRPASRPRPVPPAQSAQGAEGAKEPKEQ